MIYANIPRAPLLCLSNLLAEDADNPNSRLVADLGQLTKAVDSLMSSLPFLTSVRIYASLVSNARPAE